MHLAQGLEFYANKTVKPEAAIVIQVNESGVNAMVIDCLGRMMTVKNVPVISLDEDSPADGSFCRSFTGETLGEVIVAAELASEDELASTPTLEPSALPAEMAATVLAEAEKLAIEPENK